MATNCSHMFKDADGYCSNCGQTIKPLTRAQIERKAAQKVQRDFQNYKARAAKTSQVRTADSQEDIQIAKELLELFSGLLAV